MMPKVNFIEHNGTEHVVDATSGDSVMQSAINNLIPGINADCGGECSCGTCHVIVNSSWIERVGKPNDSEDSMLSLNPDRHPNSRLSCQIEVSNSLDGIIIELPEFQY